MNPFARTPKKGKRYTVRDKPPARKRADMTDMEKLVYHVLRQHPKGLSEKEVIEHVAEEIRSAARAELRRRQG